MQKLNNNGRLKVSLEVLIISGAIIYFAIRLAYFAFHIHPEIPPDERTHYGISAAYSKVLFIPENTSETYQYGLVTHRPYLFYWMMGKLLHLNFFPIDNLVFLRLLNGLIGVIFAVYVYKWAKLITSNRLIRILTVIMCTNILFVTGLFASVSYDNLTNLFAAMSFYYLSVFYKKGSTETSVKFLLCAFAGCLCKKTFLPLAVIYIAFYAIRLLKYHLHRKISEPLEPSGVSTFRTAILASITIVLLLLNVSLYGQNLIRFGRLLPSLSQIVGVDNAMQYRIFARNYIPGQYKAGKITIEQALKMTEQIGNEGDRNATIALLKNVYNSEKSEPILMNFAQYTTAWCHTMLERSVSYAGHRPLGKKKWDLYPYYWIILAALFVMLRKINRSDAYGILYTGLIAILLYSLLLLWHINYKMYLKNGFFDLAVAGRYLFPLILPICGLTAYYLINFLSEKKQLIVTLLVCSWFIYGDFISFLNTVPKSWLMNQWPA